MERTPNHYAVIIHTVLQSPSSSQMDPDSLGIDPDYYEILQRG